MPRPVVTDAAEELYSRLGPWRDADTEAGLADDVWYLLELCESIMGRLQPVEDVVRDQGDDPGWTQVFDVDRAPAEWLAWMAQFAGKRLLQGLDDAAQRARIKSTDGFDRGTPGAVAGAAEQFLDGTKKVFLIERHGSAYRLTVTTLVAETPDPAAVERAVRAQKPAGLKLVVRQVNGDDYNTLRDTHTSYDEIRDLYASYDEIVADPTKRP